MTRLRMAALVVLVTVFAATPSLAWTPAGHMTVAFVAYNAHFIAAMLHGRRDERAAAEQSLRRALAIVPFAQSATQLLSTHLFLGGRQGEAYALMEAWIDRRPRPVDPWRLFGYGDFRMLPALLTALRAEVGR